MTDNFEFNLIGGAEKPFRGYLSARDKTAVSPELAIRGSQNVFKKISGTWASREGLKRRGVADTTEAGILSSYEHYSSQSFVRPLRVVNDTLQVESDVTGSEVWYDVKGILSESFSADPTRLVFDAWFDTTAFQDKVLYVNGDNNIYSWAGGVARISGGTLATGVISTVAVTAGGIGYKLGDILTITGGSGTAQVLVTALSDGVITGVSVNVEGLGYDGNQLIYLVPVSGGGTGGQLIVSGTGVGGIVTSISVVSSGAGGGGKGYYTGAYATFGGSGTGLVINITSVSGGAISAIDLINSGSGYTVSAGNATTGGSGTGATINITAIVSNYISKLDTTTTFKEDGFWESGGSVTISGLTGATFEYTKAVGNFLIGITQDPSALVSGTVAISTVEKTKDKPLAEDFTNDFLKVINNQVYVGSYNSRFVYVSSATDFTNYTQPANRVKGNPFLLTLDRPPKGFAVSKGLAKIPAGTSYWYAVSFEELSNGGVVEEKVKIDRQEVAVQDVPVSHEFLDNVGDTIVFMNLDNQIKTFGEYRNITTPAFSSLSNEIQIELQDEDFSGGHLRCIGEFVFVVAPISGRAFLHQTEQTVDALNNIVIDRYWHTPQVWGVSRIAEISGVIFGHSNVNPQIYQLFNTGQWHDDSPTDEPVPYTSILAMAYQGEGRRQGKWVFDKLYTEGYMATGVNLNAYVVYDYQGETGIQNPIINSIASPGFFFTGVSPASLGDASLGDNPLGDGIIDLNNDQDLLAKFRVINVLTEQDCFEWQIIIYSDALDSRWEILALGVNAVQSVNQANEIVKTATFKT